MNNNSEELNIYNINFNNPKIKTNIPIINKSNKFLHIQLPKFTKKCLYEIFGEYNYYYKGVFFHHFGNEPNIITINCNNKTKLFIKLLINENKLYYGDYKISTDNNKSPDIILDKKNIYKLLGLNDENNKTNLELNIEKLNSENEDDFSPFNIEEIKEIKLDNLHEFFIDSNNINDDEDDDEDENSNDNICSIIENNSDNEKIGEDTDEEDIKTNNPNNDKPASDIDII